MWGKQGNWEAVGSISSRIRSLSKGLSRVSGAADSRIFKPRWIPCHSRQRLPWNGSGGPLAYFLSRSLARRHFASSINKWRDPISRAQPCDPFSWAPRRAPACPFLPPGLPGRSLLRFLPLLLLSVSWPIPLPQARPLPLSNLQGHYPYLPASFLSLSLFFFELRGTGLHKSYSCSWHFLIKDTYVAFSQFLLVGHLEKGNGLGSSGNPSLFCSRLVGDECAGQSALDQREDRHCMGHADVSRTKIVHLRLTATG